MLVQAQVVPWWGTGRPAEFSPSGFQPVTGIAYRQEDRRVRLQNRVVSTTARRALHTLSRNEKFEFFWCPLPWGSECSGNYQPRGNGKTARGIDSADPSTLPPVPGTESPLEIWSADQTAPEQVWQAPGRRGRTGGVGLPPDNATPAQPVGGGWRRGPARAGQKRPAYRKCYGGGF